MTSSSERRRSKTPELTQPERLVCAVAYVAVLLASAFYLDRQLPPPNLAGAWFTAGAIALLLGVFLNEPFHTRPVDALLTGVTLAVTAWSVNVGGSAIPAAQIAAGQAVFEAFGGALVLSSSLAILLKDQPGRGQPLASFLAWLVARVGRATFVFSAVYLAASYAAFASRPDRMLSAFALWALIVGARPLEGLIRAGRQKSTAPVVVRSLEDPTSVLLDTTSPQGFAVGTTVVLAGVSGVVVDRTLIRDRSVARVALSSPVPLREGQATAIETGDVLNDVVGYAGPGTTVQELHVRMSPEAARGLALRRLLYPAVEGDPVFYLTTGAVTFEDREGDSLTERIEVVARKVGSWDAAQGAFAANSWLANPGVAIRSHVRSETTTINPSWIGPFPHTEFGVPISISEAVTHNTAILGILGAGKTTLAWQLIRRMVVANIHVVVLDISRRYRTPFREIFAEDAERRVYDYLRTRVGAAGDAGAKRAVLGTVLERFIGGEARLLILDPAELIAELPIYRTASDLTRAVADALLQIAKRDNPNDDPGSARYCLVLEEAHTLVPEFTNKVDEDERGSVNGTARSLLQGRKYGLGCLIVTQRTANVAKSILNQCNTVFAMRMYDDTGIGFLTNYIGSRYAELLPTLEQQEAIAFGMAIKVSDAPPTNPIPLLVKVYDDLKFKEAFWDPKLDAIPRAEPSPGPRPAAAAAGSVADPPPLGGSSSDAGKAFEIGVEKDPSSGVPRPDPFD